MVCVLDRPRAPPAEGEAELGGRIEAPTGQMETEGGRERGSVGASVGGARVSTTMGVRDGSGRPPSPHSRWWTERIRGGIGYTGKTKARYTLYPPSTIGTGVQAS